MFRFSLAPLILIALGLAFLLHNLGYLPQLSEIVHLGWPLILIAVGVSMLYRPNGCQRRCAQAAPEEEK